MRKIVMTILVLLIVLLGWFLFSKKAEAPAPELVACTMEAKMCPDGSAVGRVPPDCEFAPCPTP